MLVYTGQLVLIGHYNIRVPGPFCFDIDGFIFLSTNKLGINPMEKQFHINVVCARHRVDVRYTIDLVRNINKSWPFLPFLAFLAFLPFLFHNYRTRINKQRWWYEALASLVNEKASNFHAVRPPGSEHVLCKECYQLTQQVIQRIDGFAHDSSILTASHSLLLFQLHTLLSIFNYHDSKTYMLRN